MKKRVRLALNIVLVSVLVFALAKFAVSLSESRRSQQDYELAASIAAGQHKAEESSEPVLPESRETAAPSEEIAEKVP